MLSTLRAQRTRPPPAARLPARPPRRRFTRHPPQLLLSRAPARAELPYLHSAARARAQQEFSQLSFRDRLFTLREVRTWRDFVFTAFQGTLLCWTGWALYQCVAFARDEDALEAAHPTPHAWGLRSRSALRRALGAEDGAKDGARAPDWAAVGRLFAAAIKRLEDKEIEGGRVRDVLGEGEAIYVDGVGRTGLDVSGCGEEWRRGYYQALMGAGRAAERYDGSVLDGATGAVFPREFVVGPSNPRPRPLPPGNAHLKPPREENCGPAGPPPEQFYLKVLTTAGFATGQRLRAALAYADWLRFKGLNDAAHSMHTWAIDIAVEGAALQQPEPYAELVGRDTGVLSPKLQHATDNILLAAESMGSHLALTGDLAGALPAYLSVLRARQGLPAASDAPPHRHAAEPTVQSPLERAWRTFYPPYPPPPPSGDTAAARSPDTVCASATTMAHIGELLFASDLPSLPADPAQPPASWSPVASPTQPTRAQAAGLAWTRQAADLAEATLKTLEPPNQHAVAAQPSATAMARGLLGLHGSGGGELRDRQQRCAGCLRVAVDNWGKMVARFERAERQGRGERAAGRPERADGLAEVRAVSRQIAEERQAEKAGWGWFWSSKIGVGSEPGSASEGGWAAEGRMVRERARAARTLARQLGLE